MRCVRHRFISIRGDSHEKFHRIVPAIQIVGDAAKHEDAVGQILDYARVEDDIMATARRCQRYMNYLPGKQYKTKLTKTATAFCMSAEKVEGYLSILG